MPIDSGNRDAYICHPMNYEDLIDHFKTQKAAGEALGEFGPGQAVKQSSVAEWKEKGIPVPRQAQYEILTGGKLKADRSVAAA